MEHNAETIDRALVSAIPDGQIYAVGGRVRDEVLASLGRLNEVTKDLDYLVTGVPIDELLRRLRHVGRAELVGSSFGVIKFTLGDMTVDIALPRREWSTGTHHRDFEVQFAPDIPIEEDLRRRDFRINMLARDLKTLQLLDPFRGNADLENRVLDALSEQVFVEDPLRVLRGAQFAARFDLRPTTMVIEGMRSAAELLPSVAPERVSEELTKLLIKAPRPSVGFELLREVSALHLILPELMEGWQIEQNEFHRYTVYYHSLACCDEAPPELSLRLAGLLHDVGKPRTKEGPHFYRHELVGAEMARAALERLRFPYDVIERVQHLVTHHMYKADDELTDAAIRRFIRRVSPSAIDQLFTLRHADVRASGLPQRDAAAQERFELRVRQELLAAPPFGIADLAIDGVEVMDVMKSMGVVDGSFSGDARVGEALRYCLEQVLDDPRKNDPEVLRGIVRSFFSSGRV